MTFSGKDKLFQRDGTHFSSHGANVFVRLLNSRVFKPVAAKSRVQEKSGPSAHLAGTTRKVTAANHASKRKSSKSSPLCLLPTLLVLVQDKFGGSVWLLGGQVHLTLLVDHRRGLSVHQLEILCAQLRGLARRGGATTSATSARHRPTSFRKRVKLPL